MFEKNAETKTFQISYISFNIFRACQCQEMSGNHKKWGDLEIIVTLQQVRN